MSQAPASKTQYRVERLPTPPTGLADDFDRLKDVDPFVGFHVSGRCPSCGHDFTDLYALAAAATESRGLAGWLSGLDLGGLVSVNALPGWRLHPGDSWWTRLRAAFARSAPTGATCALVRCRCAEGHAAADGAAAPAPYGCGSMWLVRADLAAGGLALSAVEPAEQPRYWAAAEAVANAAGSASSGLRDVATKWQGALTALLALGAVGAVLSRDTVQALSAGTRFWVGAFALLTLVFTAVTLLLSYSAANGVPRLRRLDLDAFRDLDLAPLRQAHAAASSLVRAVRCAMVAVATGTLAVGLLLFAPASTPAPASVKVTWKAADGTTQTVCGTVTTDGGLVHVKPTTPGQPEPAVPPALITALGPC